MSRRYASRRYAGGLGPSRIRTRIPTTRQLGQWVSLRKTLRFRVRLQLSQSHCLSLLLAMSSRVFLFFPPRGHEPPPTLRDRLNPNLSLYRHRFPIARNAKRPDVALYTVGPFLVYSPGSGFKARLILYVGCVGNVTALVESAKQNTQTHMGINRTSPPLVVRSFHPSVVPIAIL